MTVAIRILRFLFVPLLLAAPAATAASPKIVAFSPGRGAPGTVVTITGQNFGGLTDVLIGNQKATAQLVNATQIRAIIPGEALSGPVSVYTTGGQDSTVANFQVSPRIEVIYRDFDLFGEPALPAKAVIGERIYVRGANFDDPNRPDKPDNGFALFVNGVRATAGAVTSPANVQFFVPAGASTGPITITNLAGAVTSTQLLYLQPVINAYTSRGTIGQTINVYGANLVGATAVRFGNLAAASFSVQSNTNLQAVVPANAVNGEISVTTPGGAFITSTRFLVLPNVLGFSPTGGVPGTVVTVDGTALTGTTAVRFGGIAADRFTNISATRITAVVPSAAVSGPISVVTGNGTNSSAGTFYLAPVVANFTPAQGAPGTVVKVTGKSLTNATAVAIGGIDVPTFTVDSGTQLTLTVPVAAKTGPIRVTGPGGSGESAGSFRVLGNDPTVTSFSPNFGVAGTQVTLRGDNLATVTNVTFNGVKAVFAVANGTNLVATVPATATTGVIAVTSPDGRFTTPGRFFVGAATDLRTTLAVTENPAVAFGPLTCNWRVSNIGPVPATNAVGRLILPAGVTYFDGTSSAPFTFNAGVVQLNAGIIDPGETVTFVLRANVGAPASIPLAASVTNGVPDGNLANNSVNLALTAAPPRLNLERLPATGLLLTWPAAGTNYLAERRAQSDVGDWTPVSGTPENDGATLQLSVPTPTANAFFRVRLRE